MSCLTWIKRGCKGMKSQTKVERVRAENKATRSWKFKCNELVREKQE